MVEVKFPEITAAVISPNPANTLAAAIIIVTVQEVTKYVEQQEVYSGEVYAGETDAR